MNRIRLTVVEVLTCHETGLATIEAWWWARPTKRRDESLIRALFTVSMVEALKLGIGFGDLVSYDVPWLFWFKLLTCDKGANIQEGGAVRMALETTPFSLPAITD